MPRQARLDVPGALHHIMVRGIDKSAIFADEEDRRRFLVRLGENLLEGGGTVYAWVLMDNHAHLLFKSGRLGISGIMRRLLTGYAQYYNRRHSRTGHLFENRYKSILCEEDAYLLALVRYIHLNPLRVQAVATLKELDRYPWSGHRAILGKARLAWMDTEYVLAQFADTKRKAMEEYRRFIAEGLNQGHIPELTGGGLIRGWSQVLSRRRKGQPQESDERILGGGDFVQAVLQEAEDRQRRQLKLQRSGLTIQQIITVECGKSKISRQELQHGSRRMAVSAARRRIAYRCQEELGLSAAEIARHLGVNTSSITRAIGRIEQQGLG